MQVLRLSLVLAMGLITLDVGNLEACAARVAGGTSSGFSFNYVELLG